MLNKTLLALAMVAALLLGSVASATTAQADGDPASSEADPTVAETADDDECEKEESAGDDGEKGYNWKCDGHKGEDEGKPGNKGGGKDNTATPTISAEDPAVPTRGYNWKLEVMPNQDPSQFVETS